MKIIRFGFFLAVCSVFSWGEVSLGLNLTNTLFTDRTENTGNSNLQKSGNFELSAGPVLLVTIGEMLELSPWIGGIYTNDWNGNSTTTNHSSSGGMWGGCGLYFRMIKSEHFRFSAGPALGFTTLYENEDITTGLSVPVNYDFLLNPRWTMRLSAGLFDLKYYHSKTGQTSHDTFGYNLATGLSGLGLTFFYTF
jgi:hypothetical protein